MDERECQIENARPDDGRALAVEIGRPGPGIGRPGPGRASRTGSGGRRKLVMAGRVTADGSWIRFAHDARAPVRGPWSLALLLRPR